MAERVSALVGQDGRSPPVIAKAIGLTKQGLYNIMDGTTKPATVRAANVLALAKALNTTVEYIMEGDKSDPRALGDLAAGMLAMCDMLSGSIPNAAQELAERIEALAGGKNLPEHRLARKLTDALRGKRGAQLPALPSPEATQHVHASSPRRPDQA